MTSAPLPAEEILSQAKAVLAQLDGDVVLAELKEPVDVRRDRWGIAHISARNTHDLFFAQGYCMAQDRLFQVDLWRRMARGETAELFGEEAIEADRFARLIRYRGDMDAEWASYSPDTREIAEAFTAGINACLDGRADRVPIEFQLAGYRPGRWEPSDILGRMSGIVMTANFEKEISRARLIQAVGAEQANVLAPTDPPHQFAPAGELDLHMIREEILQGLKAATRVLKFSPAPSESNNWVVSGKLSASGSPLLASDPHRSTTLPSLRYLVHLQAPGWNVIGSGEPALPGVAIGHNEQIAWGFTIVGTDQADLYVERTHPEDPRRYRVGERWDEMTVVRESIRVKGRPDPVELELRFTRHGPVIYQDETRHAAIALKWAGSEPGGAAYLASLAVNRAENQAQFLEALSRWKIPGLNFVYADRAGNIGWVVAAATPVRREGDGLLPVPGDSERYDWERYLALDELPQSFNPDRGWLATANQNILPAGYRRHIAWDWAAPYRYQRIETRLQESRRWTPADFQSLQHDSVSIPGQQLQQFLGQLELTKELQPWKKLFCDWDGELNVSAQAGPLYGMWMQEIMTAMYALHPNFPALADRGDLRSSAVVMQQLRQPQKAWFGPHPAKQRDTLLAKTFQVAVERTRQRLGSDPAQWTWGRLHQATFHHPLESLGPEYARAFNVGPVPRAGDVNTPLNTRYDKEFQQVHGATYRHVFDLADWDRGLATSAPGQSGQPGSPHYADLLPYWAEGKYFPLAFSSGKIEEVTQHRLQLRPK